MKKYLIIIIVTIAIIILVTCNSSAPNNSINLKGLNINVIFKTTPTKEEFEHLEDIIFHTYKIENENYISRNSSQNIGFNYKLDTTQLLFNYPHDLGNKLRISLGLYDINNFESENTENNKLDLFSSLKKIITDKNINKSINKSKDIQNKIYISFDNSFNVNDIKDSISKYLSASKQKNTNCEINLILVRKSQNSLNIREQSSKYQEGKPTTKIPNSNNRNSATPNFKQPAPLDSKANEPEPLDLDLSTPQYVEKTHRISWHYLDKKGQVVEDIPEYIKIYLYVNESPGILLQQGRKSIELNYNQEDMKKLKRYETVSRLKLKLILVNSLIPTKKEINIDDEYKIVCFERTQCGLKKLNPNPF